MEFKNFPGKAPGEHIVEDARGRECARFYLLDAPGTSPSSCRSRELKLSFPIKTHDLFHSKKASVLDVARLIGIYTHVFRATLDMTDKKGRAMCKILSEDDIFNRSVYYGLAMDLKAKYPNLYTVDIHGRWIEIRINSRIKQGGKKK